MEIKGNINAGYGNSITGGTKSSIVGGEGNSNSATQSFIGGGYNNTVSGAYGSSVVGGRDNTLNGSYYASVVGGRGNQISGGINTYSTIGGGDYNLITNTSRRSFIGNGTSNEISGATKSSIVGGDDNYMSEGFTNFGHLFIGGGQNNTIFKTNWSVIGGGYGNTIDKLNALEVISNNNFIGGGFNNHIYNGSFCNIVGGYQNYINAGTYNYSTIGGGNQNQIIGYSKASFIGGGVGNLITNFNTHYSQYASIVGGRDNGLTGSSYSTISGGRNNKIVNTIQYYGHNFIGNGLNNTISGPYGGYSTIIGGYNNNMSSNYGGSILGGNSNTIFGNLSLFPNNSSIVGGFNNTIQLSDAAFIGAGTNNYIRGQASVILGGTNNTIGSVSNQRSNCSILGGINNTIQHNSSHIIGSNITSVAANTTHTENLDVSGELTVHKPQGRFYTDLDLSVGPLVILSGNSADLVRFNVLDGAGTGFDFGVRGATEPSFPGYGKTNDAFIYAGTTTNGMNLISQSAAGKDEYIRFYAGQDANGTTPDIHIQGSGSTRGYVGINNENPQELLDAVGNVKISGNINIGESLSTTQLNTPTLTTGIYHDYDPGTDTSFISVRTNFTATTQFTGLANGVSGKRVVFHAKDTSTITFKHNDTGSSAANRFYNGNAATDKVLSLNDTIEYIYDSSINKWMYLGGSV